MPQQITKSTREAIFDEMVLNSFKWFGRLADVEFLSRLFDLNRMPSTDLRFDDARGDIIQHRHNNDDWDDNWIYSDERFDLLKGKDSVFLRFLCETIHPDVCSDTSQIEEYCQFYNKELAKDGFQLLETSQEQGVPVYAGKQISGRGQPKAIEPPTSIPLGTIIVGDLLGRGGYGSVFDAKLSSIEHPFAIKLLDPSPFQPAGSRSKDRFLREAKILFSLRHPNIIPIYGIGEYLGKPYILMERFYGLNLQEARETKTPNPTKVARFIKLIASALGYAHDRGIVHRDIKPSNLMANNGDARVLDFGIAALLDPKGERFTKTGGTPVGDAFSAPELFENPRLTDPRCDIYSLGACWFWLLTGIAPKGRNWESSLRLVDEVNTTYEQVLLKTLNPIDTRYPKMDHLVNDIDAMIEGNPTRANSDFENNDDAHILLGILFENSGSNQSMSIFDFERQVAGEISRFRMNLALHALKKQKLVTYYEGGWNESSGYSLLESGNAWVEAKQGRIEELLHQLNSRIAETTRARGVSAESSVPENEMPF